MEIQVDKVSDDQYFLMLGEQVIGMVVNMAGGGWLWVLANPFVTGLESEKERAGEKLVEVYKRVYH